MKQLLQLCMGIFFKSPFDKNLLLKLPLASKHQESFIFSVFDYHHKKVKLLIRHLKNHNDFLLKEELSNYMFESVMDYIGDQQILNYYHSPFVIPVPISKKRFRERGFNQTDFLAKYIAKQLKGNYQKRIIVKNIENKKQALIKNRGERFLNVHNVFSVTENKKHLLYQKDVIIVDDLSTTGATLLEIKKVLEKNGARNVIAITIAH